MIWFLSYLWINVANNNLEIRKKKKKKKKKIISFFIQFEVERLTEILQSVRCHILWSINTIHQFIKLFLDQRYLFLRNMELFIYTNNQIKSITCSLPQSSMLISLIIVISSYTNKNNRNKMTFGLTLACKFWTILHVYSNQTSMARTSLLPWKLVRDMGGSSHWGSIMVPGPETDGDSLGSLLDRLYKSCISSVLIRIAFMIRRFP